MSRSILLVEDNEDDVFFMQLALKRLDSPHRLEVARDGREAKQRLQRFLVQGPLQDPLGLVLLDLKLPYLGGIEVLAWMHAAGEGRFPPTVVLSTVENESELAAAARFGAAAFMAKPNRPDQLACLLRSLETRWLVGAPPAPRTEPRWVRPEPEPATGSCRRSGAAFAPEPGPSVAA